MNAIGVLLLGTMMCGAAGIPRPEHPRPDFRRDAWVNLNGEWEFRFDPDDRGLREAWYGTSADYAHKINVPFCWESKLSGVREFSRLKVTRPNVLDHYTGKTAAPADINDRIGWYRRRVTIPAAFAGKRVWLRFGAVDWQAQVWVNGKAVGQHEGGYTPFDLDITEALGPGGAASIIVRALDTTDSDLPTGKQAYWYTPTSGIWQAVWLEARPASHIGDISLVPRHSGGEWSLEVTASIRGTGARTFRTSSPDAEVEKREEAVTGDVVRTRLKVNGAKPWTPETPYLYDLALALESRDGSVDTVHTYFGLRTIARGRYGDAPYEYVLLNGKPVYLRGALDQSFNPEGVYTAPSDDFLRGDLELAKSLGLNFLRIHVKIEEPRRLYWADRLGILIMEDMPNVYKDSPRGRVAWEAEMRGAIHRDRNHPSIFSWCLFNETWGLLPLKDRPEAQQWVLSMWRAAKELDSTRLVEDQSPNKKDHIQTDLNSFHFYSDNPPFARAWIGWAVRQTFPGSGFNYLSGYRQDGAPLLNSEYGAIQSDQGDRDVSFGFRSLTTQLRRHGILQGYAYTELTDLEWELNGLVNYDRSAKEFGYDTFVPGMSVRDLQGADFVGFDAPPAIEAAPGSEISVPVFISHYSDEEKAPRLRWWITGTDNLGEPVRHEVSEQPAIWAQYRVTVQDPIRVRIPPGRPFAGALAMELVDSGGKRLAANFVNLIVRESYAPAPRVEVLAPRKVALRFATEDFVALDWGNAERNALFPGKFFAHGAGRVEYVLTLPDFVREAGPTRLELMAEVASKAQAERLAWPARRNRLDYPQTDRTQHRGAVHVSIAGQQAGAFELADDPADSRGVLSHHAGVHHGSYGFLMRKGVDVQAAEAPEIAIRFEATKGLAIYGERMGRYPFDPTLIVETARDMKLPQAP